MIVKKKAKRFGKNLKVSKWSIISKNTILGENVSFNGLRIFGGGEVVIGNNFHSGQNVKILTRNHNYDKGTKIPYDNSFTYKKVCIENNVWIGTNVIILPGIRICEGAIIQAGSVVTKNIPYCAIAGGHPIEIFKYRDQEHYNLLLKKEMFY